MGEHMSTCHGPAHDKGLHIGCAMWRSPECSHYDEQGRPAPYKPPEHHVAQPCHNFRLAYGVTPWGETLYEEIVTDIHHIGWILYRSRCRPDPADAQARLIVNGHPLRMEARLPVTPYGWSEWVRRAMASAPAANSDHRAVVAST